MRRTAWRTAEIESVKSEAKKRGWELKYTEAQGKQGKADTGDSDIRGARSGLRLFSLQQWKPAGSLCLGKSREREFRLFLLDRGIKVADDSLYTALIASDFVEEGRKAARWLAKKTGGKANIVELQGTPGSSPAIDRKKGFEEGIAEYPDMKIIASQSGAFRRAKGKEVMEAFLKIHAGQIDAVYSHNDDMAFGAIQAIEEAGLKPGTDIVIVSVDGIREAFGGDGGGVN